MPIEINELVIKAAVSESGTGAPGNNTSTTQTNNPQTPSEPVEKAVKEILNILKRKNER